MRKLLPLLITLSFFNLALADELRFPIGQEDPLIQSWWWPWSSDEKKPEETKANYFDLEKILKLEDTLSKKIIGQPYAVKVTVNSLLSYAAGIHDDSRPIATFLYIGPTGVGKTELAKELAREIYQDESKLIRFNMSEFNTKDTVWRLLGPPQGYVDSPMGGQLSNPILKEPYSIVLLDEFEKAHPEVRALFLHIFDEGWFSSGRGVYVDCHNCIFITTTNLGATKILHLQEQGLAADEILTELEDEFIVRLTPEVYNRLEPVIFTGLTTDVVKKIVPLRLKELAQRVASQKKISVTFDETLVHYLEEHGYNMQLGARPLQRLIKKEVESAIAKAIIQDRYQKDEKMHIAYQDHCIVVTKIK